MIAKAASQKKLIITENQVQNTYNQIEKKDTLSFSQTSKTSAQQRPHSISRKPANQSNLQNYKLIKKKSQESRDSHSNEKRPEQPPKCPKNVSYPNCQPKNTESTSLVDNQRPTDLNRSEVRKSSEGGKFNKKAMTKQQIIEVKQYIQRREEVNSQTKSIAGSQKAVPELQNKQQYKKSKTEYFNLNQIYGKLQIGLYQNYSDSQRMLVVSLREKCKSVDQTNLLLNKRVSWLREEIEVHLERQATFDKAKCELQSTIKSQITLIQKHEKQIKQLKKQINTRQHEVEKLRKLVVDLNLKFENDREILNSEIQFLKCQQANQLEQRQQIYQDNIKLLQDKIKKLTHQLQKVPVSMEQYQEQYSEGLIQKLIAQNKYLKMQNHMLGRFKDKVEQLKRENKQISNQRDTLKKKIIQNLKKNYKSNDYDDQSEFQSLLSLSASTIS